MRNTRLTRALASLTLALAVLCALAFVGTAVTHILDDGAVCAKTDFWHNATLEGGLPVGAGVKASSSTARLCQDSPSAGQRAADLGNLLPWWLFGSVALLLFSRLLAAVVREGPFTAPVASRISSLGWFLTAGTPVAGLIVGWSQSWLVGSMAPMIGSGPAISGSMVLVLVGLATVIMGKIMREGVHMREDLEGTI
ncbi:DUF2975 domain-containing protein [Streptomyces vinaceus]|uniref:DUF2975 domain-containing protein n=1 Tax=Streptomyces vinaceus TaxID=1960 RepID=UPI00380640E2